MKEKLFVICDSDEEYLTGLQSYLEKKNLADFQFISFRCLKQAKEYSLNKEFEIMLLNEEFVDEIDDLIQVKKLFLLKEDKTDEETEKKDIGYTILYKYQSVEKILSHVLDSYAREDGCSCKVHKDSKTTRLITFYSPDRQVSQGLAALATGQVLGGQKRVLYLNLSPFSGLESLLHTEFVADLSDFMYFALKYSDRLVYKLEAMKRNVSGIDCMPPVRNPKDLIQLEETEWERILDAVLCMGDYQEIIVEVTDTCQGLERILERSDRIYTLYGESDIETARLAEYKRFCVDTDREDILEKTAFIPEPMTWRDKVYDYTELLLRHPGQYMKGILMKDGIM